MSIGTNNLTQIIEDNIKNILENDNILFNSREIKAVNEWWSKSETGKSMPEEIFPSILNKITKNAIDGILEKFKDEMLIKLSDIQIEADKTIDLAFDLPIVKPYVKTNLIVNSITALSFNIEFEIHTRVSLEGISLGSYNENQVNIKKVTFDVVLYLISKMLLGTRKTKLGVQRFSIDNFVFNKN